MTCLYSCNKYCNTFIVKAALLYTLGNSWNYIPLILVPSSSKPISIQIFVITKLDGRKDFILRGFVLISSVPARKYLFKVSTRGTRIRCENCPSSGVYIVNCEQCVLIIDFEEANVCWVHIEKINTFKLV